MSWFSRRGGPGGQELPEFPAPVSHEEFRKDLIAAVEQFLPHGVDEATPHVLDRLIDRYTKIQQVRRERDWARYRADLLPRLVEAMADAAYQGMLWETRHRRLEELRVARDAAVAALAGPDAVTKPSLPTIPTMPEPGAGSDRV